MNTRAMQNLGSVEVADTGEHALVKQGDFDRSATGLQAELKLFARSCQCVWTQVWRPEHGGVFIRGEESDGAQTATIPIDKLAVVNIGEDQSSTAMGLRRRIIEQHESRHAGFEDQPMVGRETNGNSFATPLDCGDGLTTQGAGYRRGAGRYLDRPPLARQAMECRDHTANNRHDAAAHRFHFG